MQIKSEVGNLVGMKKAQEEFENLRQIVGHVIKTGDREPLGKCLNLVLFARHLSVACMKSP